MAEETDTQGGPEPAELSTAAGEAAPAPDPEQEEPTAAEPTAAEPTAAEPTAAEPTGSAQPAADPEPVLAPKERRARARAGRAARSAPRTPQTPEERQAQRDADRVRKAAARRTERARQRAKYRAAEHERQATPPREHVAGTQKTRQGIVISDKADKTITVRIDVARRHRRYAKVVRTSSTVHAHDERNEAHLGDTVVVRESRPLSRSKRWRLVDIVERAR
jgi:small subunit ribosomal protein S17